MEFQEFVYLVTTSTKNIERLAHLADGGAYPAVRPEVVANTEVVKPKNLLIEQFGKATSDIFKKVAANDEQSRTLAILRDTLLPKLISGKVRVKDVEKFLGVQ